METAVNYQVEVRVVETSARIERAFRFPYGSERKRGLPTSERTHARFQLSEKSVEFSRENVAGDSATGERDEVEIVPRLDNGPIGIDRSGGTDAVAYGTPPLPAILGA